MLLSVIDRALLAANYHADLASKRRALSAWGTVERMGSGWSWTWTGVGIPAKWLPEPVPCMSAEAAWIALEATVLVITRDGHSSPPTSGTCSGSREVERWQTLTTP